MMLVVLGWLGVSLGALLLLLLLVPFTARSRGAVSRDQLAGQLELRWLFGLIALRLSSQADGGFYVLRWRFAGLPHRGGPRRARERPRRRRALRDLVRGSRAWLCLGRRLLEASGLKVSIEGRVGLHDPADTALLFAGLAHLRRLPRVTLNLSWDWQEEIIELQGQVSARIWLLQLLVPGLRFLLDGPWHRSRRACT